MAPDFYGYPNEAFPDEDIEPLTHCVSEGGGPLFDIAIAPELWCPPLR